jgi:hypothetical protein
VATEFPFETKSGAGLNEDGSPRTDFGGWYQTSFNAAGAAARYWRVRQITATVTHAPRAGEMAFYAFAAATAPLALDISIEGGNLIISWSGPGTLQSAESITGPWVDLPGASPRTIAPSTAQQFYRLRQ